MRHLNISNSEVGRNDLRRRTLCGGRRSATSRRDVLMGTELLCCDGKRLVITEGLCYVEQNKKNDTALSENVAGILEKHPNCFSKNMAELGTCQISELNIALTNEKPINRRAYRVPFAKRVVVEEMVNEMLINNIIRPSVSPFASPIVLVKKSNGEDKMCIVYRELNAATKKQPFPMPIIDELLETTSFFTTLDLMAGYYQVPLAAGSQKYTAFVTHNGHFEFLRMLFGLVNAPSTFQCIMNVIIQQMLLPGDVVSYLDNTIIASKSEEEGLENLDRFLSVIGKVGLTLRMDKCVFLAPKISFLGHKISADGIEPGDKKVTAIQNFPVPTDVNAVRRFLGLTGFFRKFVNHYAVLAKPLT